MLQAKLLVVGGGDCEQQEFELTLPATIGRGRENLITLPHPLVSRQHCHIFEGEGGLLVRDLGSLNGTYVGNQRIEGDHALQSGDLLTIGIVTFRTVIPKESENSEPALRLESVFEDETVNLATGDTRLASGGWDVKPADVKTEKVENPDSFYDGDPESAAPRKPK